MKKLLIAPLLLASIAACTVPGEVSDAAKVLAPKFKVGDEIFKTFGECKAAFECVIKEKPDFQATYDVIKIIQDEAAGLKACNNGIGDALNIVSSCAPKS